MAKITRIEALMVDLVPAVKRTDAIQSFVSQQTPIPQIDSLTHEPMRIELGHAIPSDAPGLGIAWDFDAINRAAVAGSAFTVT